MVTCEKCGGKIGPGESHRCLAASSYTPELTEILAVLKDIRELLTPKPITIQNTQPSRAEGAAAPRTPAVTPESLPASKRREKR
jgi:hypothetical protein